MTTAHYLPYKSQIGRNFGESWDLYIVFLGMESVMVERFAWHWIMHFRRLRN